MWDWVGGRTSVLSAVRLLPASLQGIDTDALLEGARYCDSLGALQIGTRTRRWSLPCRGCLQQTARRKGRSSSSLQGQARAVREVPATACDGIFGQGEGQRRSQGQPGAHLVREQGFHGSALVRPAVGRRARPLPRDFHRGPQGQDRPSMSVGLARTQAVTSSPLSFSAPGRR